MKKLYSEMTLSEISQEPHRETTEEEYLAWKKEFESKTELQKLNECLFYKTNFFESDEKNIEDFKIFYIFFSRYITEKEIENDDF